MTLMLLRARPNKRTGVTPVRYTRLDDDDYETLRCLGLRPFATTARAGATRAYAAVAIDGHTIRLHRFLMGQPPGRAVDHLNHDTLDNQRSNLRPCTQAENSRNRTKDPNATSWYIGVSGVTTTAGKRRWQARVNADGRVRFLGQYETEERAARVYDTFVRAHWGPTRCLNFAPEEHTVVMMRPWLKAWEMDQFFDLPTGLPVAVRVIFDKTNVPSRSDEVAITSETEAA